MSYLAEDSFDGMGKLKNKIQLWNKFTFPFSTLKFSIHNHFIGLLTPFNPTETKKLNN